MTHSLPFTRRKLVALPEKRRHRRIADWIRHLYQELVIGRIDSGGCLFLAAEFRRLNSWLCDAASVDPIPVETDTHAWIRFLADAHYHHLKAAGVTVSDPLLLPSVITGDVLADAPWDGVHSYRIALDNLRSLFNVGAIFRICDAVGFEGLILGHTLGPDAPGVRKTAMGAQEWIPVETVSHLAKTLENYKRMGVPVIGIETVDSAVFYSDYQWPDSGIIVFGNEEYGISPDVLGICDAFVKIPMHGRKNSINIATSVSVICFEICRQLSNSNR